MIPKFRLYSKVFEAMDEVVGWTRSAVEGKSFGTFNNTIEDIILMQSTGLKDKNGVEIFEGDVVKFEDCDDIDTDFVYANRGVIEYVAPTFHITNRNNTEMKDLLDGNTLDVIVLGNIHEHPELMEVADGY